MKGTLITLFCVSLVLNIGLISGYVRIASPESNKLAQHEEIIGELIEGEKQNDRLETERRNEKGY